MNKGWFWLLVLAVVVVTFLVFHFRQQSNSQSTIKIGVASLMTGNFAVVGENIRDTALLTVDEINRQGGVGGKKIEVIVEDAGCDSKTGLSAVSKLINVDKVQYIIGGMCSNGTVSAAPLANQSRVIIMTPVTGGKNVDEAGEYVFRTANSDILAGKDIADSMVKLGYRNVGAITEITEYTLDIKKSFKQRIMELGGAVVAEEDFQPGTKDFRTTAAKMKAANVQAVLVASQAGISGAYFVKQAKELGLNAPMFSDFTLVANDDAKKVVGSFNGVYFADPAYDTEKQELKDFFVEYKTRYGRTPPIPFHTAATYDAIHMIVAAIAKAGDDSATVHDWLLKNVKNWDGFMGRYSLDNDGNSNLGFVMKIIKNDTPVSVEYK